MNSLGAEWRPGPSVCRCCLTEGCYKDISTEYFWMGRREVYAEMLAETLDLSIAYSNSNGPNSNSRLICEGCITRLRDASSFKRQVQDCERTFHQHLDPSSSTTLLDVNLSALSVEPLGKPVKLELGRDVKEELDSDDDEDDAADDVPDFGDDEEEDEDDLDDQPLTRLATKTPKKESVQLTDLLETTKTTAKRKSSSKAKASPAKKAKPTKKEKAVAEKPQKPVKKKKEPRRVSDRVRAKRNAEILVKYSTAYPFRLRGNMMLCVYCCDEYQDPAEYRQHMEESHRTFTVSTAFAHLGKTMDYIKVDCTDLKCRLCDVPFENLDGAASHIRETHNNRQINTSYAIGMQPYNIALDKWICFLCSKKFPTINKLSRHTTSHYLKYTCEVCGRSYLTKEALTYHVRCSHTGSYVCRKCWREFATNEEKREHTKVSKSCWPFCCILCSERFMSWEWKQKHLEEVHGRPKTTYSCPDCGVEYKSRKAYFSHFTLKHTDDIFMCACCGLKFPTQGMLDDHLLVHSNEKKFQCKVCSKSFTRKRSLTQHMWIHSETKRFQCIICDKQFAQKVSLKGHMKTHHPEVEIIYE